MHFELEADQELKQLAILVMEPFDTQHCAIKKAASIPIMMNALSSEASS